MSTLPFAIPVDALHMLNQPNKVFLFIHFTRIQSVVVNRPIPKRPAFDVEKMGSEVASKALVKKTKIDISEEDTSKSKIANDSNFVTKKSIPSSSAIVFLYNVAPQVKHRDLIMNVFSAENIKRITHLPAKNAFELTLPNHKDALAIIEKYKGVEYAGKVLQMCILEANSNIEIEPEILAVSRPNRTVIDKTRNVEPIHSESATTSR